MLFAVLQVCFISDTSVYMCVRVGSLMPAGCYHLHGEVLSVQQKELGFLLVYELLFVRRTAHWYAVAAALTLDKS